LISNIDQPASDVKGAAWPEERLTRVTLAVAGAVRLLAARTSAGRPATTAGASETTVGLNEATACGALATTIGVSGTIEGTVPSAVAIVDEGFSGRRAGVGDAGVQATT
jgi:hypothetical protein